MNQNPQPRPTWRQLARTALSKGKEDYRHKLRPKVRHSRDRLGKWVELFGRKIRPESR